MDDECGIRREALSLFEAKDSLSLPPVPPISLRRRNFPYRIEEIWNEEDAYRGRRPEVREERRHRKNEGKFEQRRGFSVQSSLR